MTIKNLYPKARPHIIYNVINGRPELPAQASFSRASIGTYVDRAGIIQTAAVDEPRFNYDPETGEFLGLMLEEEGTNLVYPSIVPSSSSGRLVVDGAAITTNAGTAPDGTNTASLVEQASGTGTNRIYFFTGGTIRDEAYSFFIKASSSDAVFAFQFVGVMSPYVNVTYTFSTGIVSGSSSGDVSVEPYPNGWFRLSVVGGVATTGLTSAYIQIVNFTGDFFIWGVQREAAFFPTSYIPTTSYAPVTREPDAFSLTTSSDFDNGFSFLLDSNTTTDDFIYKIKAGGSTIAELNNDNGTLDWVIDGTSAATSDPPQYPQIAIQPGRVRTVSSFGAAGDGDQTNYLYTETLSFPTVAEPAAGADELEFGPGQTVKAVYVWDGQLSNTEAVSVIKGKYNVILNEPIQADTYSFVYNTDPTNVGEASITLPYIVPTVSMRVYWGDTTSDRYEPGVTASHTYPYPGQYRIQIEADDGFDDVRLADVGDTIYRVDQWAPQHRVGATGDGFTGDDLHKILVTQIECALIPPFKYTGLTNLDAAFYNCQKAAVNNWDWIPTNLQSATSLNSVFRTVSRIAMSTAERGTFPQLQTGTSLTSVVDCFRYNNFTQFDQGNSGLPFSNTQNVTNWLGCFRNLANLTAIGSLDTSAATNLSSTFNGCNALAAMPFITTNNVTNFLSTWEGCSSLTSFPQIDTSSVTSFSSAWRGCNSLTSFPQIDTSSGTNFRSAWLDCSSLTSFPLINTSSGASFSQAWYGCNSLTSFPLIDTSSGTDFYAAWYGCNSLTSFPLINASSVTNFYAAWYNCNSLTSFPLIDTSSGTGFSYAWYNCNSLTSFPANMFDTTGTLSATAFQNTWFNCALTAQSIENILVSLDTNGQSNIELTISGGTNAGQSTWTAAANTAYTNLINKGWTITSNP